MTVPVIACPSFHRAGQVKTFQVFGDQLMLVVHEDQLDEYRAAYPDVKLDPHPRELNGLSLVRQWMYDRYGDVFMCDDDVPWMFDYRDRAEKVPPDRARDVIYRLHDTAIEMGAFLYGCSEERNPLRYQPHRPLRLTGVVRGRAMGLLPGAKFFFPQDRSVDDEMCLSGLNAYFHRYCLVDERFAMPGDEYTPGGLAFRRSHDTLLMWVKKLEAMFGDAVSSQEMGDAKLKVPW